MIGREREWLSDEQVGDGLWIEVLEDYVVFKEYVRLWIIVKAINTFNYLKYNKSGRVKRNSVAKSRASESLWPESRPEELKIKAKSMAPSLQQAKVPDLDTNLEDKTIASASKDLQTRGASLQKTKAALDAMSRSSAAAAAAVKPSPARPARLMRKSVPTYNLAILTGSARQTANTRKTTMNHGQADQNMTNEQVEVVSQGATPRTRPLKRGRKPRKRATSASSNIDKRGDTVSKKTIVRESSKIPPESLLTMSFSIYLRDCSTASSIGCTLLDAIERDVHRLAPEVSDLQDNEALGTVFFTTMTAWLHLQRTMYAVRERMAFPPQPHHTPTLVQVFRSRFLTELRIARDAYIEAQQDKCGTDEDVICLGFEALQDSPAEGQRVKALVRIGLAKLDEQLFVLGEELGWNGGAWVRV
ncbi:hypothetical protein DE146DRAFT_654319, partial [Phaeosphaeria sp. MPI-PUGE-AT-0046c]